MGNEEGRVAAAVAAADMKTQALEAHRRERQIQMHRDIAEHRLAVQREREEAARAAKEKAEQEAARFASNVAALQSFEDEQSYVKKTSAKIVQAYQLAQMADKKRTIEGSKEVDRSTAHLAGTSAAGAVESEAFSAFTAAADELLRQEQSKGRNTFALQRAIAKTQRDPLIAATAIM